jgi:hypothetical protein
MSFFHVDSKYEFAARVNREIKQQYDNVSFAATYNGDRVAFPSDGLVGTKIGNSSIDYLDASSVQYLIGLYYEESGQVFPDDIQEILDDNRGPDVFLNYSYAEWGFNGNTPKLPLVTVISQKDATEVVGFVKP